LKLFFTWIAIFVVLSVAFPITLNIFLFGAEREIHKDNSGYIDVYFVSEDKVVNMKTEDYIRGVLMAEMPGEFEVEALKAQAVASRTYMAQKATVSSAAQEHKGADVCTDYAHCQAYISDDEAKNKWGKNARRYLKKCKNAVDDTSGIIAVFDDEPIKAVFHSVSGGRTENASDVWGADVKYLRSVDSPGEESAPGYTSEVKIGLDEFKAKLSDSFGIDFSEGIVGETIRSDGGKVKTIQLGNKTIKGTEMRTAFGLKSTNFDIKISGEDVVFSVRGYGHGVGMSQYGANHLAKQGKGYREILKKYYNGIEFKSLYE